jgi:hypothetical protein
MIGKQRNAEVEESNEQMVSKMTGKGRGVSTRMPLQPFDDLSALP